MKKAVLSCMYDVFLSTSWLNLRVIRKSFGVVSLNESLLSLPIRSDILAEYLERLLEAADELAHVAEDFVLVRKTIAHFPLEVIHEIVSLCWSLLLKVLQESVSHVSALSQHVVQITKSVLPWLLLVLDVRVHLLALPVDIRNYLPLIGNPRLLLLDQAVCDALDLRTDRVQSIVVVLNPIFLLLHDGSFKLIPNTQNVNYFKAVSISIFLPIRASRSTYIRSWLCLQVSRKISPSSVNWRVKSSPRSRNLFWNSSWKELRMLCTLCIASIVCSLFSWISLQERKKNGEQWQSSKLVVDGS